MKRFLVFLVVLAGLAAGGVAGWLNAPLRLVGSTAEVSIEAGTSPREVAAAWVGAGVQEPAWALYEWFRWSGQSRLIRAGSYEIGQGTTPRELLAKMVRGDEVLEQLRLIEGWNFRQVRAALDKAAAMKHATQGLGDAQIMAALGAENISAEGRFFPDTYAYSRGVSDLTVLKRAYRAMQGRLAASWADRAEGLPLHSADEALTLASIIEKETGTASDRSMVAAVFVNRLKIGMPLQTDPSVIYGLGEAYDGSLHKRDLLSDTAYNTYTRNGLPPTPIAMPGAASLHAALHPAASRALYFVSRGDGSSEFSDDLAAHNRAVDKYIRKQ
jgi:UPF0755 protein